MSVIRINQLIVLIKHVVLKEKTRAFPWDQADFQVSIINKRVSIKQGATVYVKTVFFIVNGLNPGVSVVRVV